jgi:hypothetical protein
MLVNDEYEIDLRVATVRSFHMSNSKFRSETLLCLYQLLESRTGARCSRT